MLKVMANMKNQITRLHKVLLLMISMCACVSINAQETIQMKKESSGVYTIPCEVNGLKLKFIFDTGASAVSISLTEATFMLKNGYLEDSDITGTTNVQTADGNIAENYTVTLKELKIGSVTLNNVQAVVSNGLDAPLLLGQSVLDKLGHWSIKEGNLVLNERKPNSTKLNLDDLEAYCKELVNDDRTKEVLELLQYYPEGIYKDIEYLVPKLLYVKYYAAEFGDKLYVERCIEEIKSFDYNEYATDDYRYECFLTIARYERPNLTNPELYLYVARNNNFPFDIRELAYESLFLTYWKEYPEKANSYAKEALEQGMYELAPWYCDYYLIERNRYSEAFQIYKKGHDKGNQRCSFGLGRGYIRGYWPIKNLNLGISILAKLANNHYPDALYDLCDYYLDKNKYDKVLYYAPMFDNRNTANIYEGICYYNQKDYNMAFNRLSHINPHYLIRDDLKSEFFGRIGELYEKGLGCRPDFNAAYDYYQQLIDIDPAWGYGMLGDMFFLNELIETDAERAYQYYVLGANNDSGYCCFRLALMNYYGVGTSKNEIKAKEYKAIAMKKGFKAEDFQF